MEIEVVPVHVNTSEADFSVDGKKIFFGLSAVKGCGGSTAVAIEESRKQDGPFKDLFDFCERVDPAACNRSAIETLIKAGAFDNLGGHRAQWTAVVDRALQSGASALADKRSGQKSLFGDDEEEEAEITVSLPDVPEWDEREKLIYEKEVLGFYLSSHPLEQYEENLAPHVTHFSDGLKGLKDRAEVTMGGMISSIKQAHTRNPKPGKPSKYANFDLEDRAGNIRCIAWPEQFAQFGQFIEADAIVVGARGAVDRRGGGDEANLIINELLPLDQLDANFQGDVAIRIDQQTHGEKMLTKLREILRGYPGSVGLKLNLSLDDGSVVNIDVKDLRIEIHPELKIRVKELLGENALQLRPRSRPPTGGRSRKRA